MKHVYNYRKSGEFYILHRNTFPRFDATFDYKTPLPEFIKIDFLDDCRADDMAKALSEMDSYMKSIHKRLSNNALRQHFS